MIRLDQEQPLQTCLVVGGEEVPIDTSFRSWLRFSKVLQDTRLCDPSVLLAPPPRGEDWRPEALRFLTERPSTPRGGRGRGARVYDFEEDADYIVGSFQQAYGIDLTDPGLEMHWHRFMALVRSLPRDTKLAEIIGYRSWSKADAKRSMDSVNRELRDMWALPQGTGQADAELVELQREWFGNVLPGGAKDG